MRDGLWYMFTTRCRNEFVGHPDGSAMVDEPLHRVCFFGKMAHVWDDSKIYNFPEICTYATKLTPTFWGSSLFYFFNAVCSLFWSEKFVRFHTVNNCIFVRLVCSHKTNKHQSNCCIESHPGVCPWVVRFLPDSHWSPSVGQTKAEIASRITAIVGYVRWGPYGLA